MSEVGPRLLSRSKLLWVSVDAGSLYLKRYRSLFDLVWQADRQRLC